ncbi:30S ribosomal protein S2 [Candidatus Adlerbacteria bacterium RIFCSPHIGHO2_01_FULL_54_23]|uniref:Small ribosomal subunit protein uS2 n=3 Tax=Candidatus Adleribacteriota TaxID=1752736 RepID=A0A1F4XZT6_9BACT|nr:MAG: 30S ribosomal protein S2 [Candidatus Adlerbacteria bacterium GW2011_GWA1_54_10]KKW38047.1 MAG: 30S ribosomal protein S2 [Candidatus Adlerbacteria bacterium GW2011_GWB1_54_7]OGC79464.1 MAG: 30S ribosomal protein S2 [Candidatus Adlerbacteria bacterium RIFCSPHIGHO2_01_FULL_54_23]OGC87118.1 MAG: 30S ribosomal protein S2 [Candidatus Adlerbacteria bacterium RIFCSPLOWO2_01_FULL_54_16]
MSDQIIEKLFSAGAHFGLSPKYRHPSAAQYLFGKKGSVELIDLEQTVKGLEGARAFVKELAAERKTILFVGGKAEARGQVARVAMAIGAPYCAARWIGGTLTNWSEIKKRLSRLEELAEIREKGELTKFTKRERLLIDREIVNLERMFGGLRGMQKLPDALVVIDPKREAAAVTEANSLSIPVVALLNTDCDRSKISYPIPGNDASKETIRLALDEIVKAYEEARQ